ncbi:MAG: enoyl-CoA hydratase/isomerase family protein [Actinobacteria bacterium]|nr:enoyl-CoA hydratase/isomerase family protein [Actinomycetota bacterium]
MAQEGASEQVLLVEDLGPVRRLTMNRPKALNALSTELIAAMSQALDAAAEDDDVRVLILRGAGRAFSAGYDLHEDAEAGTKDSVAWYRELQHSATEMLKFFDHPKPIIAQVQSFCLAGGCDLMMMCDLTVCSDDAKFGQPEIRFGSGVVTMVMPWLLGARKAKELLFTGEDRVDAQEALRIGMVNRVVPAAELDDATLQLAQEIGKNDPFAISMQKRAINAAWEGAGFREAIAANVALDTMIETADLPERVEFRRITKDKGLKDAVAWRDGRFREQR